MIIKPNEHVVPQCWFSITGISDVVVCGGSVALGIISPEVSVISGHLQHSDIGHSLQRAGLIFGGRI